MKLMDCLEGIEHAFLKGNVALDIECVAFDSREVKANSLFVAVSGFATDGHLYIDKAILNGAVAIVVEKDVEIGEPVTVIKVENARLALAGISANFYNRPTEKMNMVGITGTNGKTSITYFIKALLDDQNKKTGVIGTIGTLICDRKIDTPNTTPESLTLQKICGEMVESSVEYCLMEVSSHALDLNRVAFCSFNAGIFTNLTPDHLELHKDMSHYFMAKAKLFDMTHDVNIINSDDIYGQKLIEMHRSNKTKCITYGLHMNSDVFAKAIEYFPNHTEFVAATPVGEVPIRVNIPGEIYVYNALASIAWAVSAGFSLSDIAKGIDALKGVKGRFEVAYEDASRKVVIDFAHTEDGLEKALDTLKPFVKRKLLLVFGVYAAPGNLGLDKRIAMGKVAAKKADYCYVTSDNPKEQDPAAIIEDIVGAIQSEGGAFVAIVDRKTAIERALEDMMPGDVLLISGKGHETAQVIGKVEVPFNEKEIVQNKMKALLET
ncbi:MAG TPA: UDP-N-acetylmuramoyl-L-alanyl-D-glutamate--2,6-diaminopimelate ligase [Clostridiales bacterium UBA8960]|nr:UDP-N-acetylmuramoyl-L-alanyl-D-glutamate--2,6-diaminopimelate ligase [Clostridiales bacterium UBA8960]